MSRVRPRYVAAAVGVALSVGVSACGEGTKPTPTSRPTVQPTDTPEASQAPKGYRLFHRYDLSRNEGWQLDDGQPANADGVDRPENVHFGQGPHHSSLLIEGQRDTRGGTFYTGDARAVFQPIPNYFYTRAVVQFDKPVSGMWVSLWKRPLGGGEGEIDDWEKFGVHLGKADEDHGALHSTPYDDTHFRSVLSPNFPKLQSGRQHVIETENSPGGYTWWVDGDKIGRITPREYDAEAGSGQWESMFGDSNKTWYFRATLQAGGSGGGPIPDDLMRWRFWVRGLEVYVPD